MPPDKMSSEKRKSEKVHQLEEDAEAPPVKSRKALNQLQDEVAHLESVIFTAPSPKDAPSPEETTGWNVRRVDSKLLGIQTGSRPTPPSLSEASTLSIVTEGGMTTCGDGGQSLEREFLNDNPGKVLHRSYATAESVVKSVRRDLNADETKVQSAANSKAFFVPCTALYSIISQETVGLLLQELDPENLTMMKKEVLAPLRPGAPSWRRTIAILILIHKQADLWWFFQEDISDSELPFDFNEMKDPDSKYAELHWETEDFRNFCRVRSEVSPVFFAVSKASQKEKIVHYHCRSGEIVPFKKHNWITRAGFGEVSSYDLHEDQQDLHRYTEDGATRAVAVKKLYRADQSKEFKQEYAMLSRLSHLKTPHIAKLLGAYEVPSGPKSYDYFLMFECADSTLLAIWKEEPKDWGPVAPTKIIAKWVASQAYGLTVALKQLHNFELYRSKEDTDIKTHGIHGDLKPDNILFFKNWKGVKEDLGILQITDFGLSSFHQTQSAEDIVLLRGTSAYRPPEAAIRGPLSASFDTWSLGCLFLEFLTWLVKGPEGLDLFRAKRSGSPGFSSCHPSFWEVNEEDDCTIVSLSRVVREFVVDLYEDSNSSQFVRDFCELIVHRMLVIEELERRNKKGEKNSLGARSRNTRQTKRIMTDDLAKKLKIFKAKGDEYFTPSRVNGPYIVPEMGHRIVLPLPLYKVNEEVKARVKELRSVVPKVV